MISALLLALTLPAQVAPLHPLTVDDMLAMERLSEPTLSPDGQTLAFTVRRTDLDANRGRFDLWSVSATAKDAAPRQLTTHADADTSPEWSPDGQSLYFLSTRSGSSQIWRLPLAGGEPQQVTRLPVDVGAMRLFPDGTRALVALEVYPDAPSLDASVERHKERAALKSKAMIFDQLLARHWDTWEDGLRNHLFVVTLDGSKAPLDLTAGLDADVPTRPFGDAGEWAIAPDGRSVVFTMRTDGAAAAWSTNLDLYLVPSDGSKKPENLTADNKASDGAPRFSPDGRSIAYLAMARPKYESDRQRVTLLDLTSKKKTVLAESWDRSPHDLAWAPDGGALFANADNVGNTSIFRIDARSGAVTVVVDKGSASAPVVGREFVYFLHDTLKSPAELYRARPTGQELTALTRFNAARVAAIQWSSYEPFEFKGAKGDTVHGYLLAPAQGVPTGGKKVPLVLIVHGGPQGSLTDHFHYRWNAMAFAARNKAVALIDFHGSTGYGQAFTDAINQDWGGAPYTDLMSGVDHLLNHKSWLDPQRVGAAGASYGGFMINWINGHTDRFKALVCHDGNLDERMAYFDTEELWFPEWEHGGTPWENPKGYAKHNPIEFVRDMKTPTLVVHGARDFRVVDTQGLSTFTALQRRGIPSRLVYFPDENHWVLKPQNSLVWHREVLGWLDRYLDR